MSYATFDGVDLGYVRDFETAADPVGRQESSYPGVNGVERLHLGGRGGHSTVETLLVAADGGSLGALEAQWEAYQQAGLPLVLANLALARTYTQAVLESFRPHGDPRYWRTAAGLMVGRKYTFTFRHLV